MRTAGGAVQRYVAAPTPDASDSFAAYIRTELSKIQDAFSVLADGQLDLITVSPPKPRDGMTRYADGVNWNPGAGQGFYDYYAGSWHPRGASRLFNANITVPSGNTVANTVAETAFTTQPTFAANTLRAGDVIHWKMNGLYSTALVAPTLTAKIKIGSVLLITTGALASFIANTTNQAYSADVWITVDSIGAGGTVEAHAQLTFSTSTVATFMSNIANTATIAVNTTISNALSTTITWSVANASNTITLRQSVCELLR